MEEAGDKEGIGNRVWNDGVAEAVAWEGKRSRTNREELEEWK